MKVPISWLREFVEVTVEPGRLGEDLTLAGFAGYNRIVRLDRIFEGRH